MSYACRVNNSSLPNINPFISLQRPSKYDFEAKNKTIGFVEEIYWGKTNQRSQRKKDVLRSLFLRNSITLDDNIFFDNKDIVAKRRHNEALSQIEQFNLLEENWNGNHAEVFSKELVDKAKRILNLLSDEPEVFPTARNSIQFEYEKINGEYLEFEIFEKFTKVFLIDRNELEHSFTISGEESQIKLVEFVKEFYCE